MAVSARSPPESKLKFCNFFLEAVQQFQYLFPINFVGQLKPNQLAPAKQFTENTFKLLSNSIKRFTKAHRHFFIHFFDCFM